MKKIIATVLFFAFSFAVTAQNVGIGTTSPAVSAQLDITSTTKGLLIPRMNLQQRGLISSPIAGLVIYQIDNVPGFYYYDGTSWIPYAKGGNFFLPYAGTASTLGGAEFSITHTSTFGDAAYFNNTAGGSSITTAAGNNKLNMTSGNTGIGIPSGLLENPTLGRLVVRGSVGATVAVFDDNAAGISLQSNLPSVGFNEYYNAGSKFISTGYGGKLVLGTAGGDLGWYASNTSGAADGAMALNQRLGISREGSLFVQGLDAGYIFKDRTSTNYSGWNLYANAGKASLYRYTAGGNTITVDSTGALGLQGVTDPTAPLSFPSSIGNKIALWGDASGGHYGLGIQGSLLQLYSSASNADIAFGYGSSSAFTEKMRIKGTGNVGIGTNNPTATLHVTRGTGTDGTAVFFGTTYSSHFNYSTAEDTYIRGGKAASKVIINDLSSGDVLISQNSGRVGIGVAVPGNKLTVSDNTANATAQILQNGSGYALDALSNNGTAIHALSYNLNAPAINVQGGSASIVTDGAIGIGNSNPTSPLSFTNTTGKKIALYPGGTGDAGFGVFGNELRINSDNANADITFGYDNFTNGFTEKMRVRGNGNVGIGTNSPSNRLDINGRLRLRNEGAGVTAGLWIDGTSTAQRGFIGAYDNNYMGFYGSANGWGLLYNETSGQVNIGTPTPATGYLLNVNGKIISEEVRVQLKAAWPDYVFNEGYKKLTLPQLEIYLKENKHLPNIPSAAEVEKEGQQLGDVQRKMLEKIEELSLYIIELQKEIDLLKMKTDEIKK